ncbi:MAG TPA: hypothetical protein PKD52_08735 [Clostridiales bacterium]|nr:hypothetical protein [Clostridiales bacterium]
MKRAFKTTEAVFDLCYLTVAAMIGFTLLFSAAGNFSRMLAGVMVLILVGGDAFHLVPRIIMIRTGKEDLLRRVLGRGKQLTSITMTVFYLFLWQIGVLLFSPENIALWSYTVYILAAIRIFLCLLPQNKWAEWHPPVIWGIWRNIPFFLLGTVVAGLYFLQSSAMPGLALMWLAIALSFAFYLPVVLWVQKNPKIGMFMIPKSGIYLWMLLMCLSI